MATMEPENEMQEMQQFFHNLSDSRSIDARYNQTEGGRAVAYLDASRGRDYGPVWSKELTQGDSLHAAVLGMLYDPKEKPKMRDLLLGMGKQNSLLTNGIESASMTSTSSLGLQPLWLALQLARQLEKAPVPESYLGYILYDQDSIRYDSGRVEISRNAFTNPEELALDITATQGGFVEVYVYNASASPVWYDQFSISSTQAVIIQENHYYPFGMQIAGLELDLDSKNRYLYNGKELQDDHNLDWHDYGARMYDAQIGRWHVVDPMAEKGKDWSPYNYAFDNPIRYIDPDGKFPINPVSLVSWVAKGSKYLNLFSQASAPTQRLISGESGNTPTNIGMSETMRAANKVTGIASDFNEVSEVGKTLAKEGTMDVGHALDKGGEAISDAGILLAIPTGGTSLSLVQFGEGVSITGKLMKAGVHLSNGNVPGAVQEGVNMAIGAVTNSATSGAIKQSKKVGLINNVNQEVVQESVLMGTGSMVNKTAGVVTNKIDDEKNK